MLWTPKDINWTRRYIEWLYAKRHIVNTVAAIVTLASLGLTAKLQLKSNFSELLPEKLPSVVQLKAVTERLGGTGFLLVGVESPNFKDNKHFVEALAEKLRTLPVDEVRYFEYRYKDTRDFVEKYGTHYLNESQLTKLRDRLSEQIQSHKDNAVASFLGLNEERETKIAKPSFRETLAQDLDPRISRFALFPQAYIGTDDGKLLVIRILPPGSSLSVSNSQRLTHDVQAMIDGLNPATFNPAMKVGFAGTVQKGIEEYNTVRHDIGDTAIELVVLIFALLLLFFWSLRWIGLLMLNLALGTLWTFGFTKIAIGYLNTQTAFLGSLVVGTGINYGIILLARYLEERRRGSNAKDAIIRAVNSTSIATLLASSATAVSFASLLVADNKGLSQFGFIGCVGILFCWCAAYGLLPLWIYQLEMAHPQKSYRHPLAARLRRATERLGRNMIRLAPALSVALVMISVLGIYGFKTLVNDPLEYNYSNLQNRISLEHGSTQLNARIQSQVFKGNLSMSVIPLQSSAQAQELCPAVRALVAQLPPQDRVFESCSTLWELVPREPSPTEVLARERKLRLEIKELLGSRMLNLTDAKTAALVQRLRENMSLDPPRIEDLPHELTRRFEEQDGTIGLMGFITPESNKPLEDSRNLFNYTADFKEIVLPQTGTVVSAIGDAWIIADLLQTIQSDGPAIALLAFVSVITLTFVLSKSLRGGLIIAFCLVLATWWQLCFQGFVGIKFNFFNFIALPITFGIGVDYPVNMFLRMRENKFKDYGYILATTGSAVLVCSFTTIIGYYTLLGASNQALTSFAKLAIIGEVCCLGAALLFLPIALHSMGGFHDGGEKSAPSGPAPEEPKFDH